MHFSNWRLTRQNLFHAFSLQLYSELIEFVIIFSKQELVFMRKWHQIYYVDSFFLVVCLVPKWLNTLVALTMNLGKATTILSQDWLHIHSLDTSQWSFILLTLPRSFTVQVWTHSHLSLFPYKMSDLDCSSGSQSMALDQQQQHYLRSGYRCSFSGFIWDLIYQKFWG